MPLCLTIFKADKVAPSHLEFQQGSKKHEKRVKSLQVRRCTFQWFFVHHNMDGACFIGSLFIKSWVVVLASWDLEGARFVNFLVYVII